jgi:hypothetical protein
MLHGDLGPEFLTRDNIDAVQYGIASGMVTFLARAPAKFAAFVRSIKEGMPMAESLEQAYGGSAGIRYRSGSWWPVVGAARTHPRTSVRGFYR